MRDSIVRPAAPLWFIGYTSPDRPQSPARSKLVRELLLSVEEARAHPIHAEELDALVRRWVTRETRKASLESQA